MEKAEKITFQLDQGETESFYVLEQTRLGGCRKLRRSRYPCKIRVAAILST